MSNENTLKIIKLKARVQVLSEQLKAAERARDQAETERDAWRSHAEHLLEGHNSPKQQRKKPYLLTLDKRVG